ncbi:hypothetical protein [Leminorella grimontii]|uniref:hypothetical protein n=1 Tax=Leminorella grimontii TaxID=82981 RepID=UPI0032206C66
MTVELYQGTYSPLTAEIGFLKCDLNVAANAYIQWMKKVHQPRGVDISGVFMSKDSLDMLLPELLPLTSIERRRILFVSTVGGWTAYFDNGWRGADAFSSVSYLAKLIGCTGVRMHYSPDLPGKFGAVIMEIYSGNSIDIPNTLRSIAAVNEGTKWTFDAGGEVQQFEDIRQYKNRTVKSRFTAAMLESYLSSLDIQAFDEKFYDAKNAVLVHKIGPMVKGAKEYSLAEVRQAWR